MREIDDAHLENREDCPFCPYVVIMESLPEENKIFQCLNADCSIQSCRLCRQKSHLPLKCGELENLGTRKRTYIEENMSEALIRYCWQCKKPFIKNSGCNNVRCSYGASNCYVCQQPVLNGYAHFSRGNAAQEPGKCPMVSSDKQLHSQAIFKRGQEAKAKMEEELPDIDLAYDPTSDFTPTSKQRKYM